jgi:hypothetical protein
MRRLTGPFLMAAFVQGLTLFIHATDQCVASPSCYPDFGSISCITAFLFWVLSALGVSLVPLEGNRSTENQQTPGGSRAGCGQQLTVPRQDAVNLETAVNHAIYATM